MCFIKHLGTTTAFVFPSHLVFLYRNDQTTDSTYGSMLRIASLDYSQVLRWEGSPGRDTTGGIIGSHLGLHRPLSAR